MPFFQQISSLPRLIAMNFHKILLHQNVVSVTRSCNEWKFFCGEKGHCNHLSIVVVNEWPWHWQQVGGVSTKRRKTQKLLLFLSFSVVVFLWSRGPAQSVDHQSSLFCLLISAPKYIFMATAAADASSSIFWWRLFCPFSPQSSFFPGRLSTLLTFFGLLLSQKETRKPLLLHRGRPWNT